MSALIEFLRTFGPVAASDSLCDENLGQAQSAFSVARLDTDAPRGQDLRDALLGKESTNVILTGTAGDGKTYHIRQFFTSHFPERAGEWPGEDGILSLPLAGGRELRIIRDLSEVSDGEKASELAAFAASLLGETPNRCYLVAANDGQLLKYFRDAASREGPQGERAEVLHRAISEMLRSEREKDTALKLVLINLSRSWSEAVVDKIFDAVLEHPEWGSHCAKCPGSAETAPCPILLNRSLLRPVEGREAVFRTRIKQALRLAAANDQHIPVRQLLTLVVNILLGDAARPDDPLLTCATARTRAQAGNYAATNPYNSAIGLNLRPERRRANRVFNVFEILAVGQETNNLIDSALVQKQPEGLHDIIFGEDKTYGDGLFSPVREAYFNIGGAGSLSSADVIKRFRLGLEAQRRRAFFRLPSEQQPEMARPWRLSIFQHGGDYLRLLDALKSGASRDILDPFTRHLVRGLNRTFTGMMTVDEDRLWLAGTIGKTDDLAGRVATIEPIERTSQTQFNVRLALDPVRERPHLRVMPPRITTQAVVSELPLRPLLFEYLMRVANGSLPTSFSRQCHQEIRHFALVTQTAIKRIAVHEDGQPQVVRILALGSRGEVHAQSLEI
ncbi:hypothetical protein [Xanthobacter agilis]|uniref:hypothetical protein n=1 Tax=Xanthobacter agilis TaxID=47492 RepID=UPI00372796FE